MCGSTGAQEQLQQEQIAEYQKMQQMQAEMFSKQQEIYGPLAKQWQSIFDRGPGQKGFSDDQLNDLNATAVEGTALNYEQAARAVNENIAAQGGDEYMPSGASNQLRSSVATSAAEEESREESQIKQADYSQGYEEWMNAGQGLMSIAAGDNPLGYANATTDSGSAAEKTANDIAEAQNSWVNAALGAAGAVGGGLAGRKW